MVINVTTSPKVCRYLVILVLVVKLRDHRDRVLCLGVFDDPNVKSVERHERDLAWKFLLVHLFQNLSSDLRKVKLIGYIMMQNESGK